jgi:plasmid maintenance system antidote protein VapI
MTTIKGKPTMTYLLRQAISETDSFRAIETATGVKRQSLMKFVRGEQSLRLDMADTLAAHFSIECRRMRRKAR